jgi:glutathione S-transferase
MDYQVLGRATSSNVQALLWGMEEIGLPYERLDYGENHGGLDSDDFRALNPHGKIPVLKFGGTALFDSAAILRFLAGQHGSAAFWPDDPVARAHVDMWAEWAKHEVAEGFTGPVFWRVVRTPLVRHDVEAIGAAVDNLELELALAEEQLTRHEYLCGEAFTLADVQLGHVLYRYFDIDISRREMPALHGYYNRLTTRPAYQKVVMVSYEALRNTV